MDIQQLFAEAVRLRASDLHLAVGFSPMLRVDGKLTAIGGTSALTATDVSAMIGAVVNPQQKELFATNKELDFSLTAAGARFRANIYYQRGTPAGAFRYIPNEIRSVDELGLPSICHEFPKLRQGLVLVTGPTGHGKSTTLAAMLHSINQTKPYHIITIEDPIEYVYPPGLAMVSQRELHEDTYAWNTALRSVLREDPDVVLVGEMRDFETIQSALTIAETGHLVFATLHTNSAAQTMDRVIDVFPEHQQSQARLQLANVIEGVISQRLIPAVAGGRVAVAEIMTGTPAVRTTIREGKTHLLDNVIQTSVELGMVTLEMALAKAIQEGKISVEVASTYAVHPEELTRVLNR